MATEDVVGDDYISMSLHEMFHIVGDQMNEKDIRILKFICGGLISDEMTSKVHDGFTFLLCMERMNLVTESNFLNVLDLLRIINRHDLSQFVHLRRRRTVKSDPVCDYLEMTYNQRKSCEITTHKPKTSIRKTTSGENSKDNSLTKYENNPSTSEDGVSNACECAADTSVFQNEEKSKGTRKDNSTDVSVCCSDSKTALSSLSSSSSKTNTDTPALDITNACNTRPQWGKSPVSSTTESDQSSSVSIVRPGSSSETDQPSSSSMVRPGSSSDRVSEHDTDSNSAQKNSHENESSSQTGSCSVMTRSRTRESLNSSSGSPPCKRRKKNSRKDNSSDDTHAGGNHGNNITVHDRVTVPPGDTVVTPDSVLTTGQENVKKCDNSDEKTETEKGDTKEKIKQKITCDIRLRVRAEVALQDGTLEGNVFSNKPTVYERQCEKFMQANTVLKSHDLGSIVCDIKFSELTYLDAFWRDYINGSLLEALKGVFLTDSLKQAVGHEAIKLLVNVDEDDYEAGRVKLLQNLKE